MHLNISFLNLKKNLYNFFYCTVLFFNFSSTELKSSIFSVNDIEITEPFELNFKKEKVVDKAFIEAFKRLMKMTVISSEEIKLSRIKNNEIKNLIDSFKIKDERFIKNYYSAKFDVNFNKQNTLLFFEKKNIFPSLPKKKSIFILPILIDTTNSTVNLFNQNPFFFNWLAGTSKHFLLDYILPTEDIDIINTLNQNIENLENYNYSNIINKYNVKDFIVCLIFQDNDKIKVLSKITINNNEKIQNNIYNNINLDNENELTSLIISIKNNYEDNWKKINQINRSVKLPLNISVDANDYQKNKLFKEFLYNTEFVSNFFIKDFNNKKINYRIIFNGSPARFLDLCNKNNILIDTTNQIWQLN